MATAAFVEHTIARDPRLHRAREYLLDEHALTTDFLGVDTLADTLVLRETMRVALAGLQPTQRQVLDMIYYSGLTYEEAALRVGAPLGTIKSRARQGLMKLRQELHFMLE